MQRRKKKKRLGITILDRAAREGLTEKVTFMPGLNVKKQLYEYLGKKVSRSGNSQVKEQIK